MTRNLFDNAIFIHIPKCGGMSVWLNHKPLHYTAFGFADQHVKCEDYINKYNKDVLNQWNAYSIVRNPWDRFVSWYTFHLPKHHIYQKYNSFSDWVKDGAPHHWSEYRERDDYNPYQQLSWLTDDGTVDGELAIPPSYIYKLEDIKVLLNGVANSSKRTSYAEYYTDQKTIDIVTEISQYDIESFNYNYEESNCV